MSVLHTSNACCDTQTHTNPCFYRAKGLTTYIILPKDQWKDLHDGDHISLLPHGEFTFRIVSNEEESKDNPPLTPPMVDLVPPSSDLTSAPELTKSKVTPLIPSSSSHTDTNTDDMDDLLFGDLPSTAVAAEKASSDDSDKPNTTTSTSKIKTTGEDELIEDKKNEEEKPIIAAETASDSTVPVPDTTSSLSTQSVGSTGKRRVLPSWLSNSSTTTSTSRTPVSKKKPAPKPKKPPPASDKSKTAVKRKGTAISDDECEEPPPAKVTNNYIQI